MIYQFSQHPEELLFVAAHEHGIFQRIPADLAYLGKILLQYLVLLHAGDDLAFGSAPNNLLCL